MDATQTCINIINEFNAKTNEQLQKKLSSAIGTSEERPLMRALSTIGVEACDITIKAIEEGITYSKWKEILNHTSTVGYKLAAENDAELNEMLKEFIDTDLEPAFNEFVKLGHFNIDTVKYGRDRILAYLEKAEVTWAEEDKNKIESQLP